jgi:hypothetical protein
MTFSKWIVDCVSPEMQAKRVEIEGQPSLAMIIPSDHCRAAKVPPSKERL